MNTEKLQKLQAQVIDWAEERGIYEKSDAYMQLLKTGEEILELLGAIHRNDLEEIKDALGDIQVCLINFCEFKGWDYIELFENIPVPIGSFPVPYLLGSLNGALHYKEERDYVCKLVGNMKTLALINNLNLVDCLESAYNVIKNRKGKMINGQFVKEK